MVILKVSGLMLLLQLLWPLFQLLQLQNERDPRCGLHQWVLGGLLRNCSRWLLVIAGISTLWGPHASSSSSPWGSYCWGSNPFRRWFPWPLVLQSVLAESPFFTFFRTLPGRFVPLDKIQQEWATQGQIRDTRLRGTGRGKTGQSWVIWTIWSPRSSLWMDT